MAITDRLSGTVIDAAWLTTAPADLDAPLVAEITAGTRFEDGMKPGTLTTPRSGATAEVSGQGQRDKFYIPTSVDNPPVTFSVWREFDGTDAYWALFDDSTVPPPTRYLVLARGGFSGTAGVAEAADICDVYTVQVVSRAPEGTAKEDGQDAGVTLAVQAVNFDAVVAA